MIMGAEDMENRGIISKLKELVEKKINGSYYEQDEKNKDIKTIANLDSEDLESYKYKEISNITIDNKNWFNNKKSIIIDEEKLTINLIEKPAYMSYGEKNINFNIFPKMGSFHIKEGFIYYIDFKVIGENLENVDIILITYDDNSKLYTETIKPNKVKEIEFSSKVKSLRVALRFQGKCKINLKETYIKIAGKKKLTYMSFDKYRRMGYDIPKRIKDLKIACIFDPFTMQCFQPEANLISFTPNDWKAVFEFNRPHILMVESAWKGNNGCWKDKVANRWNNISDLLEIIQWCKDNNIPTIFWNKEDPVHYDYFINTARHFEYIFTTSSECVDRYKKDCNTEKVYVLQFAAQPKIHNPTELLNGRKDKICFAGSYYRNKYESRNRDLKTLIEASLFYGIDIYDRNYNLKIQDYKFPKEYQQYILGTLEGKEIVKANKGYKIALNLNTVKDSTTMFARRVFELLASNTPVVSNYSIGVNKLFNGIVLADDSKEIIEREINKLIIDSNYYDSKKIKGLREVLLNHTYEERVWYICEKLDFSINKEITKILIISINEDEEDRKIVKESYDRQAFRQGELIFIHGNNVYDKHYNFIGGIDELNFENYNYITYMSSKDYYGEYYLLDLFIATKYSEADIIGKEAIYINNNDNLQLKNSSNQYMLCNNININSMMVKLESVWELNISKIINLFEEDSEESKKILSKLQKYSIDKFNYIKNYNGKFNKIVDV